MSDQHLPSLPSAVVARLIAAADKLETSPDLLLDMLLDHATSLEEESLYGGDRLVSAASASSAIGVYFDAEIDFNGDLDTEAQVRVTAEFERLLRDAGIDAQVVARDFEIGRGAQGDPVTFLQVISGLFAVAAAPAVLINAWATAIPKIREWLGARNGCMTLEFIKLCCLEDAKKRVKSAEELSLRLVSGHRGIANTTRMDTEAVGPYCISIVVPERSATFIYVTDEIGQIIHFLEAPGPGEAMVIPDENR